MKIATGLTVKVQVNDSNAYEKQIELRKSIDEAVRKIFPYVDFTIQSAVSWSEDKETI